MMTRPEAHEYAPYYGKYITLVPDGAITDILRAQLPETLALLRSVPETRGTHTYAPGKWSIKEVLGHVIDTERIMAYRALRVARGDKTPLPGFEQDEFVANARFNERPLSDLSTEWEAVRHANVILFETFDDEDWLRQGTASNNPITARALVCIVAGHELYHRAILQARYLA